MDSDAAEPLRRRLALLLKADRLFGLRDWPLDRQGVAALAQAVGGAGGQGGSKMNQSGGTGAAGSRLARASWKPSANDAALHALLDAFPPELPEPPGCTPNNRPDPLHSARYGLKGSSSEQVERKAADLVELSKQVASCQRCGLAQMCSRKVFGVGHPDARLVFVGEAPGAEEDRTGWPFVGRAGKLLTAMVERGMGLRREHVYICNIL